MNFKVIGIKERKIFIALDKLCKAFDRRNNIDDENFDYIVYITVIIYNNRLKVILKSDDFYIEKTTKIINEIFSDMKYLVLVSFYQILIKLTNRKLVYGVLTGIRPTKLIHRYKKKYDDREIIEIMKDKYSVTNEKANLLLDIVNYQMNIIDFIRAKKEISIYINIPFCLSRCSYCSFTSYPYDNDVVKEYLQILFQEMKTIGKYLHQYNVPITSIYVGGGTPTALKIKELKLLLDVIDEYLLKKEVKEYTLECGRVDSLDWEKLKLIKNSKVTRISINPQTFNEKTLLNVNRKHSINELYDKYQYARDIGFNNINMDLIIGLPNENLNDIIYSIDETIALKPESITIHYLAQKKRSDLYNEDLNNQREFYFTAFDYAFNNLKSKGYIPYYLYRQKNITGNLENIGYALNGYASIYNILMIEEQQTIIGLGSGASSKFINYDLIINPRDLKSYINSYKNYLDRKLNCLSKTLFMKDEGK